MQGVPFLLVCDEMSRNAFKLLTTIDCVSGSRESDNWANGHKLAPREEEEEGCADNDDEEEEEVVSKYCSASPHTSLSTFSLLTPNEVDIKRR